MSLSEADLQELYRRAQLALNSGYTIARGEDYAALLGGSDGSPAELVKLCESALQTLSGPSDESSVGDSEAAPGVAEEPKAEEPVAAGEAKPEESKREEPVAPAPEPSTEAPAPDAPAAVEAPVEALAEAAPVEAPVEAAPEAPPPEAPPPEESPDEAAAEEADDSSGSHEYEGWTRKQLIVEAEAKGVEVKHSMSKGDIIAALRAAAAG